jgi:hypothetical protein
MKFKKIMITLLAILVIVSLTSTTVSAHHPGSGNFGYNNAENSDHGHGIWKNLGEAAFPASAI